MSTEASHQITVGGLRVDVVRKPIKNLHLGVYPPHGRVRVAAPLSVNDEAVRLAVVTRMAWIKGQRAKFDAQSRQSERTYVSGETHYFLGRPYRLKVIEGARVGRVRVTNGRTIQLHLGAGTDLEARERLFNGWYRDQLRARAAPVVKKWSDKLQIPPPDWRIKRMKTKWGTCSVEARRIWINLELIKKSPHCLEYIVVHEMAHLFERTHSDRFRGIIEGLLPQWRIARDELNIQPLAHEDWASSQSRGSP